MNRGGRKASARGRERNHLTRHIEPPMNLNPYERDEIGNINMKLELLRKKKEALEIHQNLLSEQITYGQGPYDSEIPSYYGQCSYNAPGPSRLNRDFARFYEDPAGGQDYIPLNSGRKRQSDGNWSRGSGAKFFKPRESDVVKSFGSRLGPRPVPQTRTKAPRAGHSRPPPENTRISTQNVSKNLQGHNDRQKYILRANCDPSTALNGLIELAIGLILKEMQKKYGNSPEYSGVVTREYYKRRLKKGLRYRIRNLITNKYIDNYIDIVHEYRKKFPLRTDKALVQAASKDEIREDPTNFKLAPPNPKTEAPRAGMPCPNFFKRNMQRYVKAKLYNMFNEIEEYNLPIKETNVKPEHVDNAHNGIKVEDRQNPVKKRPKQDKWKVDISSLIYDRLRSALRSYIPTITRILNMDPEYNSTRDRLMATAMNMDPTVNRDVVIGDSHNVDTVEDVDEPETIEIADEPETIEIIDEPSPKLYHAKVRGIPNLPPREQMLSFLDEFIPKTIKTHKKMKNLLIVTFSDKDSFDFFLSKDGVNIGNCALDIKVSGKAKSIEAQKHEVRENICTGTDSQASVDSNEKAEVPLEWTQHLNNLIACLRREDEEQAAAKTRDKETILESTEHTSEQKTENIANEPVDTASNGMTEGTDQVTNY